MFEARRVPRALSALIFLGALVPMPARADGSVSALGMGMGAGAPGAMARFDAVVQQYNASGERFRIDSHCQSACTLFLAIRNVCITPNATLLFHSGGNRHTNHINPASTQHMLDAYKPALRQYVSDHHFMDTFDFHTITGREMIARFGYPAPSRDVAPIIHHATFRQIRGPASPLLALSGHPDRWNRCSLLGVKRTSKGRASMSASDPKRTSSASHQ